MMSMDRKSTDPDTHSQHSTTLSQTSSLTGAFNSLNGFQTTASSPSCTTASSSSSASQLNGSSVEKKFTVFSLQQLLENNRRKKLLEGQQAPLVPPPQRLNTVVTSSVSDEVEIVVVKAQPIVIDLVSDDDEDSETQTELPARFAPLLPTPSSTTPSTLQVTRKPDILHFDPTSADAMVPVKLEKCSSQEFLSECNSTIDSGDLDADLAPVKLEWPAQRMDKYEMAAMRGDLLYL